MTEKQLKKTLLGGYEFADRFVYCIGNAASTFLISKCTALREIHRAFLKPDFANFQTS